MTKYNKKALGAAEDSVAFSHDLTYQAIATAVFDTLKRAPWWEEVGSDYRFGVNEPGRIEGPVTTVEALVEECGTIDGGLGPNERMFRDTRWQPPVKPLKVGDLIDTEEQAASLPVGTIAVSRFGTPIRKASTDEWQGVDEEIYQISDIDMAGDGDRIIYLPSGDSE